MSFRDSSEKAVKNVRTTSVRKTQSTKWTMNMVNLIDFESWGSWKEIAYGVIVQAHHIRKTINVSQ